MSPKQNKEDLLGGRFSMTIGRGFFIVVFLSLLLGVVGVYSLNSTATSYDSLLQNEVRMSDEADLIEINLLQARRAEKDFMYRADLGKEVKVVG